MDDPLDAGRWINCPGAGRRVFPPAEEPRGDSGLYSTLTRPRLVPLEMTEEYVSRCVLMLCCALLSANASNWL